QKIIELDGFKTEGIFRVSPSSTDIDSLRKELLNNNYNIQCDSPHIPAGMLKDWFRGLSDSLIPKTHYGFAIKHIKENKSLNNELLNIFLSQLPVVNRECIKYLVKFLKKLLDPLHENITKMNLDNVAVVFSPTILRNP